ncbi:hypothetical protein M8J77_016594 [Diaphorina citri]|nr:hypothetical protein M8J77_016594 [Diaphorina citri]
MGLIPTRVKIYPKHYLFSIKTVGFLLPYPPSFCFGVFLCGDAVYLCVVVLGVLRAHEYGRGGHPPVVSGIAAPEQPYVVVVNLDYINYPRSQLVDIIEVLLYVGYGYGYGYPYSGAYSGYYGAGYAGYPYAAAAYPYSAAAYGAYPYSAAAYPYSAGYKAYPYTAGYGAYSGAYPYAAAPYTAAYGYDDGQYYPGKYPGTGYPGYKAGYYNGYHY